MKIVFFRHSLLSRGGDKMVLAHASHLADAGHCVSIKTNKISSVFPVNPRICLESIVSRGKFGTVLSSLHGKLDGDFVIADIIPLACLLYLRNRHKVVYFAQDYDESYYKNLLQKVFTRCLYRLGLSIFRIPTIAVSEELGEKLRKNFGAKVDVVLNGVDSDIFYPAPSEPLLAEKEGRKSILLLSRSDQRKGFDIALEVISRVIKECGAKLEVWTVGEKVDGKFPGLKHRDFGYVSEDRLRVILSSADLFFYPTRHEGFGLMAAEAFACKCPVVTTDAVSFAKDEENALVSRNGDVAGLADKVLRILNDRRLAENLVEEGLRFATENSLRSATRNFECKLVQFKSS
jgi:glycosyltransferase involved in cell wall biosynthesis